MTFPSAVSLRGMSSNVGPRLLVSTAMSGACALPAVVATKGCRLWKVACAALRRALCSQTGRDFLQRDLHAMRKPATLNHFTRIGVATLDKVLRRNLTDVRAVDF